MVRETPVPTPAVTPTPTKDPVVSAPPRVEKEFRRFDTTIVENGFSKRIIWLEVTPGKWKRFDSEREVDAYKQQANSVKPATKAGP